MTLSTIDYRLLESSKGMDAPGFEDPSDTDLTLMVQPVTLSRTPSRLDHGPSALGADSREVLEEFRLLGCRNHRPACRGHDLMERVR